MNKPTPETDAETIYCDAMPNMPWVDADICRKLERERDEAREQNAKLFSIAEGAIDIILELEQLKKETK
jgi:hypothetical protein